MRHLVSITILLLCLSSGLCMAQPIADVEGKIIDPDGQAFSLASVVLYQVEDSSVVKLAMNDEDGSFLSKFVFASSYWLDVSYAGLPGRTTDIFERSAGETFIVPVYIQAAANELTEVTIKACRPLLEMKPDKMVFNNLEGSNNAVGSDTIELLRKAPGVVLNNNDNIILLGKSSVRTGIDALMINEGDNV